MIKNRVLFIGVGQSGGNIASELDKRGYLTTYINTSNVDLHTIKSPYKYHVPGATGCNKDRRKALEFAENYYNQMADYIDERFTQDIVMFCFSLGGGTGSGIGPVMLDVLARKNPDKHYGAVVVLPSLNESLQSRVNAMAAYKDLMKVENLRNIYVLDNNNLGNKFEINYKFAEMFDRLIHITNPDHRGIIDIAELETLLKTKGSVYISEVRTTKVIGDMDHPTTERKLWEPYSIFAKFSRGCRYIAVSMKNDSDMKLFEETLGKPVDIFKGYNDSSDFLAAFGMPMPKERLSELAESINSEKSQLHRERNEFDMDIPDLDMPTRESKREENFSFDDIFNKYK